MKKGRPGPSELDGQSTEKLGKDIKTLDEEIKRLSKNRQNTS
jgi:hypothetical protein